MSLLNFLKLLTFCEMLDSNPSCEKRRYLGAELILVHILDLFCVQACSCRHPVLSTISLRDRLVDFKAKPILKLRIKQWYCCEWLVPLKFKVKIKQFQYGKYFRNRFRSKSIVLTEWAVRSEGFLRIKYSANIRSSKTSTSLFISRPLNNSLLQENLKALQRVSSS